MSTLELTADQRKLLKILQNSREFFAVLKAAGISRLVERTMDEPGAYFENRKGHDNLGHISNMIAIEGMA